MINIWFMFIFMFMLTLIMLMLNSFLSMNKKFNREKNTSFECGFNPQSNSRLPFTTHFFLITLLFLIFDVEIMLIIPSLYLLKSFNSFNLSLMLYLFLTILIISLIYEWIYSLLNWIFY